VSEAVAGVSLFTLAIEGDADVRLEVTQEHEA